MASDPGTGTADRFQALAQTFTGEAGVTLPGETGGRGFGSTALKVRGSIFAMLTRGQLVIKLPGDRVTALIRAGVGGPFDAGRGTPMKEWLVVLNQDDRTWTELAREAFAFVGG